MKGLAGYEEWDISDYNKAKKLAIDIVHQKLESIEYDVSRIDQACKGILEELEHIEQDKNKSTLLRFPQWLHEHFPGYPAPNGVLLPDSTMPAGAPVAQMQLPISDNQDLVSPEPAPMSSSLAAGSGQITRHSKKPGSNGDAKPQNPSAATQSSNSPSEGSAKRSEILSACEDLISSLNEKLKAAQGCDAWIIKDAAMCHDHAKRLEQAAWDKAEGDLQAYVESIEGPKLFRPLPIGDDQKVYF